jgi:hypothetical protein
MEIERPNRALNKHGAGQLVYLAVRQPRNDGDSNIFSGVSSIPSGVLLVFTAVFILVNMAYPQIIPYVSDVVGEDGVEESIVRGSTENGELRLLGTFKLFNPDTVPFYLWAIFENGGKFKHSRYGDLPAVRLVDLELRYRNARQQPMVKKFPIADSEPRVKKRFGGSWLGGGRSGKKGARGRGGADEEVDFGVEAVTSGRAYRGGRGRGRGVYEIVFWKEDVQAYYEMELWGVLYAPDVREAVVAGRYVENISFELEVAR